MSYGQRGKHEAQENWRKGELRLAPALRQGTRIASCQRPPYVLLPASAWPVPIE